MNAADDWRGRLGAGWAARADAQDLALAAFGAEGLATLAEEVGAHGLEGLPVLDLGCGPGATTLALARRGAQATGVDVSPDLLAIARARAEAAGPMAGAAGFVEADAATAPPPGPYGALFSRFGCMFFDPAPPAWEALRAVMRPGAPLVCVAWRAAGENEWVRRPLERCADLRADLPAPPRAAPGAPGPFGWADPRLVADWLTGAGWKSVAWRDVDADLVAAPGDAGDPADAAAAFLTRSGPVAARLNLGEAPPERVAAAQARLRTLFAGRPPTLGGAARIFSARA
ncbi:MAG: class I SAM-dependent methyltransferase [Pseudomonadota bacterium]|nr:class I SAM-dependent methyltransferase [Pseudomonadota bacterium]